MTLIIAICVGVVVSVSVYLLLGKELKGIAMGVFLFGHAANLSIIAMSGSPIMSGQGGDAQMKEPPVITASTDLNHPLTQTVDPLPQALILTAIVIGFAVMGFLLALTVVTGRGAETLDVDELGARDKSGPSQSH